MNEKYIEKLKEKVKKKFEELLDENSDIPVSEEKVKDNKGKKDI